MVSGGVEIKPSWTAAGNTSDGKATIFTTPVPHGKATRMLLRLGLRWSADLSNDLAGLDFLELFNTSTSKI